MPATTFRADADSVNAGNLAQTLPCAIFLTLKKVSIIDAEHVLPHYPRSSLVVQWNRWLRLKAVRDR